MHLGKHEFNLLSDRSILAKVKYYPGTHLPPVIEERANSLFFREPTEEVSLNLLGYLHRVGRHYQGQHVARCSFSQWFPAVFLRHTLVFIDALEKTIL